MTSDFPKIELIRIWELGSREERVSGLGDRRWLVQDLRLAVADQPVFQVPLAFLDLSKHNFDGEGGLINYAIHMRKVNESNPDDPVIFDQWGRILDGRHRIVKALLEGRTVIPAKKVPDGTQPTYYAT
jgi:hypothetical protein